MAPRKTRAAAAKSIISTASSEKENAPINQATKPPKTPARNAKSPAKGSKSGKATPKSAGSRTPLTPNSTGPKRKRVNTKVESDGEDELPHNLGKAPKASSGIKEENGSPIKKPRRGAAAKQDTLKEEPSTANSKRSPKSKKLDLESQINDPGVSSAVATLKDGLSADTDSPSKKKAKGKSYGLTPGQTPFPDWKHPTPEEAQEVHDLLTTVHGKHEAPAMIPVPSTTVSGCGEVPSILDALIRTLLSAATTGANSSRAFQGLVSRFGLLETGIGKGSVDWDHVRRSDVQEVFEAIKSGGLAQNKSKNIKAILDLVHEENLARRDALLKAKKEDNTAAGPAGIENMTAEDQKVEIEGADQHRLSLDHLHALNSDDALNQLIKYPGIGPKTASCVLLFCMRRPSFAVDTHVFRLCKWLGWVPSNKANRNNTYSHCEVMIPDHLKYPLHQLFIRHGKTCPRCRAATGEGSGRWEEGCVIDHLVTRTGKRKSGFVSPTKPKKSPKGTSQSKIQSKSKSKSTSKRAVSTGDESEAEMSEMSDDDDDDDDEEEEEAVLESELSESGLDEDDEDEY
jgi:endonuclease III